MRKPWVGGNWKMNGDRVLVARFAAQLDEFPTQGVDVALFPPATLLSSLAALCSDAILVGGQDLSSHPSGAYTGEISAAQWLEAGARCVLVGHSERRQYHAESSSQVAAKYERARGAGLQPVLCVGETLDQREGGRTESVLAEQLDALLDLAGASALTEGVLAYEPVWAIGTGRTASPQQAQDAHRFLRDRIRRQNAILGDHVRIVYGGSVKRSNAAELFSMPDVDGGLIGGASLDPIEFAAICCAAAGTAG